MAVGEPIADEAATAGSDAAREREEAVRTKSGTCRRDIVARIRREVEAELARVRTTARLVEQDRIGPPGYLALLLAIGVNVYGFITYGDRYMLMWVVASLYFYTTYWLLPIIYGVGLALLHRKESAQDRPAPEPRGLIRSVKEARLLRFKRRLITVGWNVWFLGGVSMTAGYLAIFSVDILYAMLAGYGRRSPRRLRRIDRAVSLLAETRLYRVQPIRLTGLYTLFLLGSDYLALLSLREVRRMDPRLRLPGRKK